jgi:uncharacterized protein (TIGR02246 family)
MLIERALALVLLATLPGITVAQVGAGHEGSAETAIRKLVEQYVAAREPGNGSALEALFTKDADQLVSSGEWRRGRTDLVAGTLRSSQKEKGHRTITVETIRFIDPQVAIVDGRYDLTAAGQSVRHMWTTLVCKQEQDGWKIAAIRNMLPAHP